MRRPAGTTKNHQPDRSNDLAESSAKARAPMMSSQVDTYALASSFATTSLNGEKTILKNRSIERSRRAYAPAVTKPLKKGLNLAKWLLPTSQFGSSCNATPGRQDANPGEPIPLRSKPAAGDPARRSKTLSANRKRPATPLGFLELEPKVLNNLSIG